MKPALYSRIQTTVDVKSGFTNEIIPKGTLGRIVEIYDYPEGYAVDVEIPDTTLVGDVRFDNIVLTREQFIVLES